MAGNDEVVVINESVKKRGRGGKYNFPSTVEPEDKEDVRAALSTVMKWYSIGKAKVNTPEEWDERTDQFFSDCINNGERPTWEKYCLAVGHPPSTVWAWGSGDRNCAPSIVEIIKRAKALCMSYDAEMVTTGKMRDTPYIFRAKNWYGMKDVQDIVVEPKQSMAYEITPDQAAKFAELPED